MRILVAEDDTALASFVKKGLEAELYTVDVSAEGEQARAMAGELDFDLVVLDLNLPRMDGVAILGFLRTRKPSMPILVSDAARQQARTNTSGIRSHSKFGFFKLDRPESRRRRSGRVALLHSKYQIRSIHTHLTILR